ncbi:hypothetical protein J2D69_10200 [Lysinibacillus sphaericus]|uniref:Uncharacterized protein n=3 Tax=Lysinibacillus TaxID=400634 RepID=B1HXV1_LYSSC|nr:MULTISPECIES: hypothetical protein [Lysinibacillus]MBE5082508.1 hypothetical protein [Bacillus thuringiensis]MBG9725775.1 hypothetical protein [Lysinibacillus fusiformis]ACA40076.1 conserved hypothetical protein [Lysinibacillus sphaericus C3-41]AMO35196.1 hypothetical protein AR327_16115 [Lysinibacillus sphaericus]AMR91049.1 hypothetical protein A1T07_13095 [Lysinibacillus sphaericus]
MSGIDKRNRLSEEPFTYEITKNGNVAIYYEGKQIKVVKENEAERLLAKIHEAEQQTIEVQLLLAKMTGNFKRGNEKLGKQKRKV